MVGIILILFQIFKIYGAQYEIYCINVFMAVFSALGVFWCLANGNLVEFMIYVGFTPLLVYYSYLIKYNEIIVNQSNNIELGENNPNENTAIIKNHNSKEYTSEK